MNMYKENLVIGQFYSKHTVQCMFLVNKPLYGQAGFLLRFVKGGNKFAIAGGHHLFNVCQGMIGLR